MKPYYVDGSVSLYHGDALDVLRELPNESVDAVVTDPPYGLEFLGREWDGADGFRRSLNQADAGRDSVFGRVSRTSPEYRTTSRAAAGMAKPGIGDRETGWPSHLGGLNPKCRNCGRWQRGGNPCRCESPDFPDERLPRLHTYQAWCQAWAAECLRVLKPGGHLLAFGGARTVHRLACAIEDAGFEIRDGIDWIQAQGFPKSLDVSKAIDKAAGAEREAAQDARRWSGWGTALKPAREPIVVARTPLAGTVAANVLTYGTGALNIEACRVGAEQRTNPAGGASSLQRVSRVEQGYRPTVTASRNEQTDVTGRWPSNVVLSHAATADGADLCGDTCVDGCPVAELDKQSGVLTSGANPTRRRSDKFRDVYGEFKGQAECVPARGADSGGASRFFPVFRYEAKADSSERPRVNGVAHPTVKPLELMRWLVRLVTPPGGLVLDPFAGSGTTGEACVAEGFRAVLVEREAAYLPLITARLSKPIPMALFAEVSA